MSEEHDRNNYQAVMRTLRDTKQGPAQRLYNISDLFGFVETGITHLSQDQLLALQDELAELRALAHQEDPEAVMDDEGWGTSAQALDQLAAATGKPWREDEEGPAGLELIREAARILSDPSVSWAERLARIDASPKLTDRDGVWHAFQQDCDGDDSPPTLAVMRSLRQAYEQQPIAEPPDNLWNQEVMGLLHDYYNDLKSQGLLEELDPGEEEAIDAFLARVRAM